MRSLNYTWRWGSQADPAHGCKSPAPPPSTKDKKCADLQLRGYSVIGDAVIRSALTVAAPGDPLWREKHLALPLTGNSRDMKRRHHVCRLAERELAREKIAQDY